MDTNTTATTTVAITTPKPVPTTMPVWAALLPVLAALAIVLAQAQRGDNRLHVWFLNVGEGNATLIKTPTGHTVLVDGGPGVTPLAEGIGSRLPFWQRNLDVVVLTQPQQENMMGLVDLLERYKIEQVVQAHFTPTTPLQQIWMSALSNHKVPVHYATRGDTIGFHDEPDLSIKVLNPGIGDILKGDKATRERDASVALHIKYGSVHILLTGDIGKGAEATIVEQAPDDLPSQILKIAQHGSAKATSGDFIQAIQPQVSIISVGSNKFGYPAAETLDLLHDMGSQLYRTDQNGTIEIIAEKDRFWVQSEK